MTKKYSFGSWVLFILLCIIWGSSFILMRWSTEGLNSVQIASLRIFSGGIVLIPFAFFHILKIPAKKLPLVIFSAVCGNLLPAYLFAGAIAKNIDSSLAGILNSLTPICVIVVGLLFFKLKISNRKILGVLIGFTGLCLLTLSGKKGISFENLEYALWILAGTILYGFNINIVSHYLKEVNPIHLATVSLSFMIIPTGYILWQQDFFTLMSSEFNLNFNEPSAVRWPVIASIVLGVVASAIATVLFYMLVKKAGGLFASLVTYGVPFIAIAWGFIYGENITVLQIGCLGIILGGVYLANR
jgi:drug/metabolite transporter (DMT)-like permease